jgi:hypothetical protein
MGNTITSKVAAAFLWLGRGLAVLLFLFWGAFFVEHLAEWFMHPQQGVPPAWVWVAQGLHASMLVGLALMAWKDKLGAVVTAMGTIAFFAVIGMKGFPYIALLNLLPIACFAVTWLPTPASPPGETRPSVA